MGAERNVDYDLGQLESKVDGLADAVAELLVGQKEAARYAQLDRRRMHKRLNRIAQRSAVIESQMETMNDRVDAQGAAIADLERFHEDHKLSDIAESVTVAQNKKWIRWMGTGVGGLALLEGDHATGGKALKWLASLFTAASK